MTLSDFLKDGVICFLEAGSRDEAMQTMVDALKDAGKLSDAPTFYDALIKREKIVSTGIGMGVAIPHAKLDIYDRFFIAVGIQKGKEGIEWDSLDGVPVKLIFMIGGPINQQTAYLQILSHLTGTIKDEVRRQNLYLADTPAEVIKVFEE